MISNFLSKAFGVCCMLLACAVLSQEKPSLQYAATEVADGLYMLEGVGGFTGGNIALSVGEDGVVMIDDGIPKVLDVMQQAIKRITDRPVDFLINTHFHWDHVGNNGPVAKAGARIFAHENARQRLREELGKSSGGALPVFTFSQEMRFYLNGNDTHIMHVPQAHTDGDIVIFFKTLNVVHTGDVYINGLFPYIDLDSGGSITGMIKALQTILTLTDVNTKIIPGHGGLATRKDLEATVSMLEASKAMIGQLVNQGKSEEEVIVLNPLSQFKAWGWHFIHLEKMTQQVYRSLVAETK